MKIEQSHKLTTTIACIVTGFLVAVPLAIFLSQAHFYFKYINDDAHITLRYARFLVEGMGPYFNLGERVEGYTNFLLVLADAVIIRLFGFEVGFLGAKIVGLISGAMAILLAFALIRVIVKSHSDVRGAALYLGFIGAGLTAASPSFGVNCFNGLETALYSMLLTAGVVLGALGRIQNKWRGVGIAFGLAVITRPEGVALFGFYLIGQVIAGLYSLVRSGEHRESDQQPKPLPKESWSKRLYRSLGNPFLIDTLIVAVFFGGHLAFRFFFYEGELLPNTYYAKLGIPKGEFAALYIQNGLLASCLGLPGLIVALGGLIIGRWRFELIAPLAALAVGGACLPFITGIDWMIGHRLVVPYLPAMAALVVIGWAGWIRRFGKQRFGVLAAILMLVTPLALMTQQDRREKFALSRTKNYIGFHYGHIALADWLKNNTRPMQKIALMDIGIVGYELIDRFIIDISGLTDRTIAKSEGAFLDKIYDPAYVLDKEPEIIIIIFSNRGSDNPYTYQAWTRTESRLFNAPQFRSHYQRQGDCDRTKGNKATKWACAIGAVAAFNNGEEINADYFLTVFKRGP